jgi:hypothetical protein
MHADALTQLSRAIDAALDAAVVPALVLLAAALVITAAVVIRAHVHRHRPRGAKKKRTARTIVIHLENSVTVADNGPAGSQAGGRRARHAEAGGPMRACATVDTGLLICVDSGWRGEMARRYARRAARRLECSRSW